MLFVSTAILSKSTTPVLKLALFFILRSLEVIAFEELGCESVKRLEVENFPLIVAVDSLGNDLFQRPGRAG